MNTPWTPRTPEELADAVCSAPRVVPAGSGTKPRLGAVDPAIQRVSLSRLSGLVEYDPGEFTFTARAGTPVRDIVAALAERGQCLPFDPPWLAGGSTLGGLVAGGVAGPGRFRFGGIRDFILGVRFVDGAGRLLRLGGKVVKNAAGFDLPKFFTGSAGRFGILAEATFKVFPRPASTLTLRIPAEGPAAAAGILMGLAATAWEPDALEVPSDGRGVVVRLAGPGPALETIARKILARWPGEILGAPAAAEFWTTLREFGWAAAGAALARVAILPTRMEALAGALRTVPGARCHVGAGGHVAFVALATPEAIGTLDAGLAALGLSGMLLRGTGPLWLGARTRPEIAAGVKRALDPEGRFPGLDD